MWRKRALFQSPVELIGGAAVLPVQAERENLIVTDAKSVLLVLEVYKYAGGNSTIIFETATDTPGDPYPQPTATLGWYPAVAPPNIVFGAVGVFQVTVTPVFDRLRWRVTNNGATAGTSNPFAITAFLSDT